MLVFLIVLGLSCVQRVVRQLLLLSEPSVFLGAWMVGFSAVLVHQPFGSSGFGLVTFLADGPGAAVALHPFGPLGALPFGPLALRHSWPYLAPWAFNSFGWLALVVSWLLGLFAHLVGWPGPCVALHLSGFCAPHPSTRQLFFATPLCSWSWQLLLATAIGNRV